VTAQPLIARVAAALDAHGVPYAVVGAAALAAHGVARSMFDLDLLTTSTSALERELWTMVAADGATRLEIRRGEADDPLLGLVRVEADGQRTVDVVVGRHAWQGDVVRRAARVRIAGVQMPVVTAADLVLLKLYAGGSQDCWDIEQLLAGPDRASLTAAVDGRVGVLPIDARQLWRRFRPDP